MRRPIRFACTAAFTLALASAANASNEAPATTSRNTLSATPDSLQIAPDRMRMSITPSTASDFFPASNMLGGYATDIKVDAPDAGEAVLLQLGLLAPAFSTQDADMTSLQLHVGAFSATFARVTPQSSSWYSIASNVVAMDMLSGTEATATAPADLSTGPKVTATALLASHHVGPE